MGINATSPVETGPHAVVEASEPTIKPLDLKERFKTFLGGRPPSDRRAIDIPPDQREAFFELTKQTIFPLFAELGKLAGERGTPSPTGEKVQTERFLNTVFSDGEYGGEHLSLWVFTPNKPKPFEIDGKVIGTGVADISVNYGRFFLLDNGKVAFEMDYVKGSRRLLDTPDSMFDPPYGGNPAYWVTRLAQRQQELITRMENEADVYRPQPQPVEKPSRNIFRRIFS
jgi:hypothetical protein